MQISVTPLIVYIIIFYRQHITHYNDSMDARLGYIIQQTKAHGISEVK